jgi:nucleoside-diphosphate-sugar epimerase
MNGRWFVVTGVAGFVGSRLIRALNERGADPIVLVDSFSKAEGVPPWITELTARPLEKMGRCWSELEGSGTQPRTGT